MRPVLTLRWALRECRGARGRMAALAGCLALGVGAVVAVTSSVAAVEQGVAERSRELLGADLVLSSRRALPEQLDTILVDQAPGTRRTDVLEMASMVAAPAAAPAVAPDAASDAAPDHASAADSEDASDVAPGKSTLVELKVVDGAFPFYGELRLDPSRPLHELLARGGPTGSVVVAPALLHTLGLAVGDTLMLGGVGFPIAGTVLAEPDRLGISFTLGPRVFVSAPGFAASDLSGVAQRVDHRALLALPPDVEAAPLAERLRRELVDPGLVRRVESGAEGQPSVARALERVRRGLGLMALLSLVLGGIGVSQVVAAWLGSRTASVAVMRCLGLRPSQILVVFLGQVALLAGAGCLAGAAAGASLPWLLPHLAPQAIPATFVHPFQPWAWARGLGLGLGLALVFAAPPVSAVWRVSPAAVLRARAVPLPARRGVLAACLAALTCGVFASAWSLGGELDLAAWFTGVLAVTALVLYVAAHGLMALVARLPRERLGAALRHGMAALARPGAGTVGAVTALGLGVLVVLAVWMVATRLAQSLANALPRDAPTAFLVDIQPDQWPELEPLLERDAPGAVRSVPVVMARLAALDGVSVSELLAREDANHGDADREDADGEESGRGHAERGDRDREGADRGNGDRGNGDRTAAGRAGGGGDGVASGQGAGAEDTRRDERRREGGRSRWVLTREQRLTWMQTLGDDNTLVEGALWNDPEHDEVSLEQGYAESLRVGLGSELLFDVQGIEVPLLVTSIRQVEWRSFGINFFLVVEPGVLEQAPHFRIATVRMPAGPQQRLQDVLAARFPNLTLLDVRAILERVAGLLTSLAAVVGALGGLTLLTGLGVLAGSVASTSLRRGREAALLKTLGVTRGGVVRLFATEHALLGLVAGAVGGLAGLLLARGFLIEVAELPADLPLWSLPVAALTSAALAAVAGVVACRGALARPPLASLRE